MQKEVSQFSSPVGRKFWIVLILFLIAPLLHAAGPSVDAKRKAELDQLRRLLPKSDAWEAWLQKTGELPPDFDSLPSLPYLPDPLKFADGRPADTAELWTQRRTELLRQLQYYVIGSAPPPPGNVRADIVKTHEENGMTVQELILQFGPDYKGRLNVELIIPKAEGPLPVFMTQDNHRRWALIAASRGYLGCVYAGADSRDDTPGFIPLYPEYDWTKLARRAWAASRCIDYLVTLPNVDKEKIALTGHSRNGKLSLIAAALDDRIAAVISSSSGAGGSCSYRFYSEAQFGESIEMITRAFPDWLHPRLRFFAGRENKLPVDQHELIACIAPRPCLISTALNDAVESVWAVEQTVNAASPVYSLLGAHHQLNIRYRNGSHETVSEDIESYLDWLDTQFERQSYVVGSEPFYPGYFNWLGASGEEIQAARFPHQDYSDLLKTPTGAAITRAEVWESKKPELRVRIAWSLGETPPMAVSVAGEYGLERQHPATMLGRATVPKGLAKRSLNFGNYVNGDLYFPTNADHNSAKLPAVIWVHPVSISNGYVPGYKRGENPHLAMARLGFAVLAFDQIGNGMRLDEVRNFYTRYPHWSLMGRSVSDISSAIDALEQTPFVDAHRIFVVGYDTGAKTALHAAALDPRIAGVVSVAGFSPMRLDTEDQGTGGLARFSQWIPLQPRLGAFVGHEDRVPYDYHEVLAMIAPRPVLVVSPQLDYQVNQKNLRECVEEARKVFQLLDAKDKLQWMEVEEFNRFSPELQEAVYAKLKLMAGLR